jgi:hypothetical protein
MAEAAVELRDAAGAVIATERVDADYARGLEGLWRTSTDEATRRAVQRGLPGRLAIARDLAPLTISLVIDGVEIG